MTKKKYRASKFNMIITTANILMLFINLFAFNNDTPNELPVVQTSTETYSEYSTYNQNEILVEEITIVSEVPVKEPTEFQTDPLVLLRTVSKYEPPPRLFCAR